MGDHGHPMGVRRVGAFADAR